MVELRLRPAALRLHRPL